MLRLPTVFLVLGVLTLSLASADDKDPKKDPPKKEQPRIGELLNEGPEAFIKRFDKNKDGFLTADELPEALAPAFPRADRNGDGKLDKQEVEEMLKRLKERMAAGNPPPAAELERRIAGILERMDTNKDGKISKDEARGPLADNFARFDANKDGFIDKEELKRAMPMLGMGPGGPGGPGRPAGPDFDALDKNADGRLTAEELKGTPYADAFAEIDTNKDGKIDPKEFAAWLKKRAEKSDK